MADQDTIQGVAAAAAHTGHVVQGVAGAAAQIGHQLASHISDPNAHGGTAQAVPAGVTRVDDVNGATFEATRVITEVYEITVPRDEERRIPVMLGQNDDQNVQQLPPNVRQIGGTPRDPLAEERREAARQVVEGLETPQPQQQPADTQEGPTRNQPSWPLIIIAFAVVALAALYVIYQIFT